MGFIKHRYVVSMLMFFGLGLCFAMRLNLSVAIIAMTGSRRSTSLEKGNLTSPAPEVQYVQGEFDWREKTKGAVLFAFPIGYTLTQIPGGVMADKLSVKGVFGYSIFLSSMLALITHWVARWSVYGLIGLRILQGLFQGVTFPAVFHMIAKWAPVEQRTTMLTLSLMGCTIGTVIVLPAAAALCESPLEWPSAFYIPGAIGIVWSLVWYVCVTSDPENHRWISDEERDYIIETRGTISARKRRIPWLKIVTSRSVLIFTFAHFCWCVVFNMFLTEIPTFINNMYHISIVHNGGLNSFFNICFSVVTVGTGYLSDRLIKSDFLSKTNVRKLFECSCLALSGIMLLIVTQVGWNWKLTVAALCCASVTLALNGGGDAAMPLDLAPSLAGSIMGFGNMVGNLAGVLVPLLVSYVTENDVTLLGWNIVFYTAAGLCLTGAVIFGLFATADEEPWSEEADDEVECIQDK